MSDELMQRLEAMVAGLEAKARESERRRAVTDTRRAEAARSGELGADWQAVQRRIDAGQTTLRDVFGGTDDSPEAQRLVRLSRDNLERLAAQDPPDEVAAEMAALDQQWDRLRGVRPGRPEEQPPA